jgi:DNA-methyltransferase, type I restriction-modification enzyme subunit M
MAKELKHIPNIRFPEFLNSGEWNKIALEDVLDYEQPTKYIVESDNYKEEGTPVLTANKSIILGYTKELHNIYETLPTIIFDDFTADSKYIDFPFKIKSSAIKLLTVKSEREDNLRFIFETIQLIPFEAKEHKRHYISEFQKQSIYIPQNPAEQKKITDCLSSLDDYINATQEKIDLLQVYKKGFQQLLFATNQSQCPIYRFSQFEKDGKWRELKLSDTCELIRGPFGGSLKKESFVKEGYAVYEQSHAIYGNMESFRYHISEDKFKELKRFRVHSKDIIMSCSGTMGKFAVIPNNYKEGIINQALLKLSAKKGYDYRFIKQLLELPEYQDEILSGAVGGAIKNIASISQIKKIPIYIPNLEEQIFIADFFASIDDLLTLTERKLSKLKEYKKGLMQQLFYK